MKTKLLFLFAACYGFFDASCLGIVVFRPLGDVRLTDNSLLITNDAIFYFDLTGDSRPDFRLFNSYVHNSFTNWDQRTIDYGPYSGGGSNVVIGTVQIRATQISAGSSGFITKRFAAGEVVQGDWHGGNNPIVFEIAEPQNPYRGVSDFFNERGYIGFEWGEGSLANAHVGWIDVTVTNTATTAGLATRELILHGIAWETEVNTPVIAGVIPEPSAGILALFGAALRISRRRPVGKAIQGRSSGQSYPGFGQ